MEYTSQQLETLVKPEVKTVKPPSGNWWKAGILIVGILLAGSIIYAAWQSSHKPSAPSSTFPSPTLIQSAVAVSPTPTPQVSPTVDETAGWKMFTNTKYGYSFKYPNDFEIEKGPAANFPDSSFSDSDNISFTSANHGRFAVQVNLKDHNGKQIQCTTDSSCLQTWMEELKITPPDEVVPNLSKTIFGKKRKGFEHIVKNKLYTQGFEYFVFIDKGKVWNIELPGQAQQKNTESEELFNQILSTFKFLE